MHFVRLNFDARLNILYSFSSKWNTYKFLSVNCNWFSCALILFILSHCNFPLSWVFDICLIFNVFVFFPWLAGFSFISSLVIWNIFLFNLNQRLKNGSGTKVEVSGHGFRTDLRLEFFLFFFGGGDNSCVCFFPRTDEPSPTWLKAACIIYFLHRAGDFAYVLYAHVWETFEWDCTLTAKNYLCTVYCMYCMTYM